MYHVRLHAFPAGQSIVTVPSESRVASEVYGCVCAALLLTAAAAAWTASSPATQRIASESPGLFVFFFLCELLVAGAVADDAASLHPAAAASALLVWAVFNGVVLGGVALAYAGATVVPALLAGSVMFAVMGIARVGMRHEIVVVASIGIVIATGTGALLDANAASYVIGIAGAIVFAAVAGLDRTVAKTKLMPAAFSIYVDSLNLFFWHGRQ